MKSFTTTIVAVIALQTSSGADAKTWYPDYSKGFVEGICINTSPAPDGVVTHDSQLTCCESSYAGQSSGACIADLQGFPCSLGGCDTINTDLWYPDYSRGFIEGICINEFPVPNGIITHESQLACCESSYSGQSSGACLFSLPTSVLDTLPEVWFPVYSDQSCVSTREAARHHGVNGFETQVDCCVSTYGPGSDAATAKCFAGLPNPPTPAPTPVGGLKLDVWYPDYSLGWNSGVCSNTPPVPNGIIAHESQLTCCDNSYAGQGSGVCLSHLPTSVLDTLPEVWFPVYSDQNCVSTKGTARHHGVNGYETQLECCASEYGHGTDTAPAKCFEGLPNPPTPAPTQICGPDVWYPDYTKGFIEGICINTSPNPNGVITFTSQEACCQNSYAGQSSGVCLASILLTELECCKNGLNATLCLGSLEYEDVIVQIIRSSIGFPNITFPETDQGIQDLMAELQAVFDSVVFDSNQIALRTTIVNITAAPAVNITAAPIERRFLLDHRHLQNGNGAGITVETEVEVQTFFFVGNSPGVNGTVDNSGGGGGIIGDFGGGVIIGDAFAKTIKAHFVDQGYVADEIVVTVKTLNTEAPTPSPTPSPSPPPQDLSRRRLAEQIDKLFDPKNRMSLANDRNQLRTMLEETFGNVGDVEDIILDTYDDSMFTSESIDGQPSLSVADNEDYYAGLPEFAKLVDLSEPLQCKCVDCKQDKVCGGIWKGEFLADYGSPVDIMTLKIHIVVSHCTSDLYWISDYTKGFDVASIHVISTCGEEVIGAPGMATIEVQPNAGGCDHTYAYYITTALPQRVGEGEESESVVIFLKDDMSPADFHQSGRLNDFEGLVRAAASEHGFGCGITPGNVDSGQHGFILSAYHETETLHSFSMDVAYNMSEFKSLGLWWNAMGAPPPPEAMQVCYGGLFSGSVQNIFKMGTSVWKNIEMSLSRRNNIQERHYAERSWALLMSTPLQSYQLEALLEKADGVHMNQNSYHGALLRRPKLFIHIGSEGTLSTELLTESLVENIELLQLDGYKIAVHGKYEGGKYGFPNIDRLGACLWDDMGKSLFPGYMKEATRCSEQLLPTLSKYMKEVSTESHDMILLNPWLVRPGTAGPLSIYLDPVWDASIVIYYRRFFEWITFKFNGWRRDLFKNSLSPDKTKIPQSSLRYIDFLREYCKQLFYGKDVNEDGFPVRRLNRYEMDVPGKKIDLSESDFDPTTNFDLEELTGLEEYVYFVAKQYHSQARFRRGIKIVNYHDTHGVEANFYCHVLHDAPNSCKDATQRGSKMQETLEIDHERALQMNTTLALSPSIALEDVVIKAYIGDKLSFDASQPRKNLASQILLWIEMVSLALQENNIPIEHLPIECLYTYERRRLLEASLAYEKSLLPDFFASPRGARNLKKEFEEQRFCSVDTDAILSDSQWGFLFDAASNFTIPKQRKAIIHIGAPRTGGSILQRTMAMDKGVLKEDRYLFFADHGHLAPCVWSDTQRQVVAEDGGKDAAACPEYLLPYFHEFMSNATAADSDVVISDEWLSMPSSEIGLMNVLNDYFDPVIVIYYRHFFDWVLSSYYERRLGVGVAALESMRGKVRLVDFIRLFCSHLFESDVGHSEQRLLDLLSFPEYTYNSWEQYVKIPTYKDNVKIVNLHDGHVVKSFYCNVLNAEKACKLESDRLENNEPNKSPVESTAPNYHVEMAMGLNWTNGVSSKERYYELGEKYKEGMARRGLVEDDLPKECLSQAETSMLLVVSLEYERILLPDHYSSGGEEEMRQHFASLLASGTFCSVDMEKLIDSPKWHFLFEPFDDGLAARKSVYRQ